MEEVTECVRVRMLLTVPEMLRDWWTLLGNSGRSEVKKYIMFLPSLMDIEPKKDLIEAMIPFWDEDKAVFRFGDCELTPALEEIGGFAGLRSDKHVQIIAEDIQGKRFLQILGLKKNSELDCLPKSWISLNYLYNRFALEDGYQYYVDEFTIPIEEWGKKRIMAFLISFLGIMVFPRDEGEIHIKLGFVVNAMVNRVEDQEVTIVPMILAEIYRAITKCKDGGRFFEGCNLLLQLWMMEHLDDSVRSPLTDQMFKNNTQIFLDNRIEKHEQSWLLGVKKKIKCPSGTIPWMHFLRTLDPKAIQWIYHWLPCKNIIARSRLYPFLVLIGICGTFPYAPLRVVRQFGRTQCVPMVEDMRSYRSDYKDVLLKREKILKIWKQKRFLDVLVADDRYQAGYADSYPSWLNADTAGWVKPSANIRRKVIDEAQARVRYLNFREKTFQCPDEDRAKEQNSDDEIASLKAELLDAKAQLASQETHMRDREAQLMKDISHNETFLKAQQALLGIREEQLRVQRQKIGAHRQQLGGLIGNIGQWHQYYITHPSEVSTHAMTYLPQISYALQNMSLALEEKDG